MRRLTSEHGFDRLAEVEARYGALAVPIEAGMAIVLWIGVVMSAALTVAMAVACWLVFRSGWRLKS